MAQTRITMRRLWLGLVLLVLLTSCGFSAEPIESGRVVLDPGLAERVDTAVAQAMQHKQLAGISLAVARGSEVVFASGYGHADLASRIPVETDTVFRLGSIGKTFTAAAVLKLVEKGDLTLDDSVVGHLPDLPDHLERITVRDLLSHTSGLAEHAIGPILADTGGVGYTRDQLLDLVATQPLQFEPGTQWSYGNAGFMLAGEVIESVVRTDFSTHLEQEILDPLGLSATSTCPDSPEASHWARGYDVPEGNWPRAMRLGRRPPLVHSAPINMDVVYAAGFLCSTVTDLVRWPRLLQSRLLSSDAYATMTEPTVLAQGTRVGYGLGLEHRTFGSHRALAHGGVINGFVTMLATFPDDDTTIALLVNTLLPETDAEALLTLMLGAVFDEPPSPWTDPYGLEYEDA